MWSGGSNEPPSTSRGSFDSKVSPNTYSATTPDAHQDSPSSGSRASFARTGRESASLTAAAASFVESQSATQSMDVNLTPSRFDAPLQVQKPSQIQSVSEFARFEKMLRSWLWRKGLGMALVAGFAYNAFLCPIIELQPSEENCVQGLRRRKYFSEYVIFSDYFKQVTGIHRKVWLFSYNQPLDDDDPHDADKLMFRNESARAQRTKAATEALKFNSSLPQVGFGAAPLRPEELPANVKWKSEQTVKAERELRRETEGDVGMLMSAINPKRRHPLEVLKSMWISVLRWVPRTFTFNRPWGDNSGNSIQYNRLFFEPVTFSKVKAAMLTVRPVELKAPDGTKVKVRMLCQLYYRREESQKIHVGHMKYGEAEAMLDYVAPQVCDAWLSSFTDLQELINYAPPFRRTGTKSVLQNLPIADYLANAGEEPPQQIPSLIMESPKSLDRSVAVGSQTMTQEELLRRYLTANILRRMDSRIAVDDVFWFLKVEDVKDIPDEEKPGVYERPNIDTGNFVL